MVVTSGGDSISLWQSRGLLGEETLIQSASRPRRGAWSAPGVISASAPAPNYGVAAVPKLGVAPSAEAFAVWRCLDGTDWMVEAASRPPMNPGGRITAGPPVQAVGNAFPSRDQ